MTKKIQKKPNIEASEVTPELIESWKQQYDEVHKIVVGDKVGYLKNPDRTTLSYGAAAAGNDGMKLNEILLKRCWLAGDMEIQTKDSYFISSGHVLEGLIKMKEARLEKL